MDRRSFLKSGVCGGVALWTGGFKRPKHMIDFTNKSDWRFSNSAVYGSAPNYSGQGSPISDLGEIGVEISNSKNWIIDTIEGRNFNGACVDIQSSPAWYSLGRSMLSNCYFHDSYWGIRTRNSGEYVSIVNPFLLNNVFGIEVASGNISISNPKIAYCSVGAKFSAGPNDSHGSMVGGSITHCTYLLTFYGVSLGETIADMALMAGQAGADQGIIQIINSVGLNLVGNQIAYCDITIDSTSQMALKNNVFRGPVNVTIASGGILDAKGNMSMPGAVVTLNGVAWSGNN